MNFDQQRAHMVEDQIMRRGIKDPATLQSMRIVPRHLFVPATLQNLAYTDGPLAIGEGQTISQPYIVALMTSAAHLKPGSKCLEIGTGSGYGAAILSQIAAEVYTVERLPKLAENAQKCFDRLGYSNIHIRVSNGTLGWEEYAPYDAIIVTAGGPTIPEKLIEQLKTGGYLIIPVGDAGTQQLLRLRKNPGGGHFQEILEYVRFVPLIGEQGWQEDV